MSLSRRETLLMTGPLLAAGFAYYAFATHQPRTRLLTSLASATCTEIGDKLRLSYESVEVNGVEVGDNETRSSIATLCEKRIDPNGAIVRAGPRAIR